MPADYLHHLAEFVTGTRLEELDGSTVEAAKDVLLDTIGAILAGSRLPENASLARLAGELGGVGPATLLGHDGKAQTLFAALVNATAGVSLEMDEGNRLGGGHPSIHVMPGAIAVGEELGSSGQTVLESIIVGYEVTSRVGAGTRAQAEVHSHGTWGTIGVAAATARLMGFDTAQTRQTMNLAMSMSPANTWTSCLEGATIRNLYPGRSSFQGILAAHLCRCGFTGVQDGPADLYRSILGEKFNPETVIEELGQPGAFRIQQNYFKLHACCLYNHPVLDAVQALLRQERFTAAEVAHIQVVAPSIAATMTNPEPENMLAAKFSIPYAVAVAIARGVTDVSAFYPEQVVDPQIRELAHHVKVVPDPAMNLRRYDYPAAKIEVTLKDGRTLQKSVTAQYGDAHNPISHEELVDKFTSLASGTLGEGRTQKVIDTVYRLDQLDNIRELTRLLGS
jgi:2-methylcitrate dehydratase PrpD